MTVDDQYQSLYRKFRPQRFDEVLGQQHVTRALRNAVATDKVVHAYLFSGPRGTGKTSSARILAKALNCAQPLDGEPCGVCESCQLVREGRSFDVEELDAASNSGVDAIRSLISTVATASYGKWKVYIIDEVHMLSQAASNALLKTLEEPPGHVVFVLATTSPQKVLQTIRSRTQHFEFHLLDDDSTGQLLEMISAKQDLALDSKVIEWARRKGGGSARDTLSFLDQALALGEIPDVDEENDIAKLVALVLTGEAVDSVELVERLSARGLEPLEIAEEMLALLRESFLYTLRRNNESTMPRVLVELEKLGTSVQLGDLTHAMEFLGRVSLSVKDGLDPLSVLESLLVSLAISKGAGIAASLGSGPAASPLGSRGDDHSVPQSVIELSARVAALEEEIVQLKRSLSVNAKVERGQRRSHPPQTSQGPASPNRGLEDLIKAISGDDEGESRSSSASAEPSDLARQVKNELDETRDASNASNQTSGVEIANIPNEDVSNEAVGDSGQANHEYTSSVDQPASKERLVVDWGNEIFQRLSPRCKARFQTVHFLRIDGPVISASFPQQVYLDRANDVKAEVEREIRSFYGNSNLRLVFSISDSSLRGHHESDRDGRKNEGDHETFSSSAYRDISRDSEIVQQDPITVNVMKVFPTALPVHDQD